MWTSPKHWYFNNHIFVRQKVIKNAGFLIVSGGFLFLFYEDMKFYKLVNLLNEVVIVSPVSGPGITHTHTHKYKNGENTGMTENGRTWAYDRPKELNDS
jgi:hypothetical protein